MAPSLTPGRRALTPSSRLPLAYFALAHVSLLVALVVLVTQPGVPGAFFYHPQMVALVHLVTIGWVSGSILGAFYIVAPLALGLPLPVGRADWLAWGAFVVGTACTVAHFWLGSYGAVAATGVLVVGPIGWVAVRTLRAVGRGPAASAVVLHIRLAFLNMLGAGGIGLLVAADRATGWIGVPAMPAAFAHAHLAAVGWALMMVVGLSYRLIPMMLPAVMPTGPGLAASAVLIEIGLVLILLAAAFGGGWTAAGAVSITTGLGAFVRQLRRTVARRLPRPPALPRRDWSTWQTHVALLWLLIAVLLGLTLSVSGSAAAPRTAWVYGMAGLVGFLAQIVVGMQGRLVPLYAYYSAMARRHGVPPSRAANDLPSSRFAGTVLAAWTLGVPVLTWGLATGRPAAISAGAVALCAGVVLGGTYLGVIMRAAARP